MTSINPQRVRFGPFEADLDTHELWKNGIKVKLGGQPFEILELLVRKCGQMVSREELRKELWAEDTFVDFNHGLNAAVNKLRETLADSAEAPKYIETLPRRGYRFIGAVEAAAETQRAETGGKSANGSVAPPLTVAEPPTTPLVTLSLAAEGTATTMKAPRRSRGLVMEAGAAVAALLFWVVLEKWPEILNRRMEEAESRAKSADEELVSMLVQEPASDPAISPDGKLVAFRRNSYAPGGAGIYVTSSERKEVTQLTQHPGDCCPAWSPDGKMLAFMRIAAQEYGIYLVDARGSEARKISHEDPRKKRGELAWTPDGRAIAFSGDSPGGGSQIFLLSIGDSSVQALTEPRGQERDWGPAFSPDGAEMAFVRGNGAGFPEEIFVMPVNGTPQKVAYRAKNEKTPNEVILVTPASGGAARQLTNERAAIMGPPAWSQDGQSIIFSSTKEGDPALWKIPIGGGAAARMQGTGRATWHPSVARDSGQVAAQKIVRSSGIYRLIWDGGTGKTEATAVTATNGRNEGPRISPDGKRMVFMSDRSGYMEIWVGGRDGSNMKQLTDLHGSGTPRWSPDGAWIAFDSPNGGRPAVWAVPAQGGAPHALVQDQFENSTPSWSNDGKWVYFSSQRSGRDEVWKIPAEGGAPIQVTRGGGFAAMESPDGRTLYFTKTRYDNADLYQMPVSGGTELPFAGGVRPRSWAAWSVTPSGIFYIPGEETNKPASIEFYDFGTRLTRQLSLLDRKPFWLSVSADGRELLFDQAEQDESCVVLVKIK